MFEEIDRLIEEREEDFPNNLLRARDLLLEIVKGEENKGPAYARLAHALFWLGEFSESDSDKDKYFGEAVEHGKKAVELAPDMVESHLWYGASMGSHGVVRGIMSSLFYLGPVEKHGTRAMEMDRAYFMAAPLRLMGRFFHQAPGWPIGSGDTNKAIKILEEAVQVGPEFLYNQIYLADAYLSKGRKDEAKKLLEDVLGRPEPEKGKLQYALYQRDAKKLMEKL